MQKLSNKQSAKVICRLDRPILAAHAFDYIVLRINTGLTVCEDLAMALQEITYKKHKFIPE